MTSYLTVLRRPHTLRTYSAVTIGRLSYGVAPLSLLVAASEATSYAWAAATVAAFGLTAAFLAPLRARLLDLYGSRRVLPVLAVGEAAAFAGLTITTWRPGTPVGVLLALGLFAGASAPPLGPVMRALWSELLPDDGLRHRAFALDTVVEELIFVLGPLLAGIFIAVGEPALGMGVSAVLVAVGTFAFVTSPLVAKVRLATARTTAGRLPPGLLAPVVVAAGVGATLGVLELLTVAAANAGGSPAAVAWLQAGLSLGSAVGGFVYGALTWRSPARRRLPMIAFALAVAVGTGGLVGNLVLLGVVIGIAGLFVAPALATAYLAADDLAADDTRVRAGAWVNSALNLGSAGGTAGAGVLVGHLGLPWCFAVAAAPALVAAVATLGRGRSRVPA